MHFTYFAFRFSQTEAKVAWWQGVITIYTENQEILFGKSNGTYHSIWNDSEIMGHQLIFLSFFSFPTDTSTLCDLFILRLESIEYLHLKIPHHPDGSCKMVSAPRAELLWQAHSPSFWMKVWNKTNMQNSSRFSFLWLKPSFCFFFF